MRIVIIFFSEYQKLLCLTINVATGHTLSTGKAKSAEIRGWRGRHKLFLLYSPLLKYTPGGCICIFFSTDGKNESWNHCIYKQIKALGAALYPQRSPLQLCSLSLSLYVAKLTVKVWGRKSHVVWVSLIFPSNGGNSTAPQQSVIKTLFSPSVYCKPEGSGPNSAALWEIRDPGTRTRSSQGRFLPYEIWANLGITKALELLPHPPCSPGKVMNIRSHWSSPSLRSHPSVSLL